MAQPAPATPAWTTPEAIMEFAQGFQNSRILLTAFELDLFSALDHTTRTSAEVAQRLDTDPRATDRLMNALAAMGFLTKTGEVFANTEASRKWLVKDSPDYLSALFHSANLYDRWSDLTAAVYRGSRLRDRPRDGDQLRHFIEAMHNRGQRSAAKVVAAMELSGVRRALDVGGGSGIYAMALCQRAPELTATVFDLPEVVALTAEYVAAAGLSRRIDTRAGDFLTDDLGQGYDLVFISAIVHMLSPEENRQLLTKAVAALNPGGQVAVQDFVMDPSRTRPLFGAVFALNMLVNTRGGDVYTEAEIVDWLRQAGCLSTQRLDTGPVTAMVVGRRG